MRTGDLGAPSRRRGRRIPTLTGAPAAVTPLQSRRYPHFTQQVQKKRCWDYFWKFCVDSSSASYNSQMQKSGDRPPRLLGPFTESLWKREGHLFQLISLSVLLWQVRLNKTEHLSSGLNPLKATMMIKHVEYFKTVESDYGQKKRSPKNMSLTKKKARINIISVLLHYILLSGYSQ